MDDSQTRIQSVLEDKYEIKGLIQSGGMGKIFLGVHKILRKKVAIKIIHQELVTNEDIRARFSREAKLAATLNHPAIIDIYDFGNSPDFDYIIMPFIDGGNLQERITINGFLEPGEGVRVITEIAEALHYAHSRNVIHRDIKPSNILFDSQDRIIIADFGISKELGGSDLTMPNMFMGSPRYMSPEQIQGTEADARSDLYSLGLVFYEMLTGIHPFKDRNTTAIYYAQVHETPYRPESLQPDIPSALGGIVMKLLKKNPNDRYPDGAALVKDLRDYQSGKFILSPEENDVSLLNDTILISDAALIQDMIRDNEDSLKVNTIFVDSSAPESRLIQISPITPPPSQDIASMPGSIRQHITAKILSGLAFLVIISGISFFIVSPSNKKPIDQMHIIKHSPAKTVAGKKPDPSAGKTATLNSTPDMKPDRTTAIIVPNALKQLTTKPHSNGIQSPIHGPIQRAATESPVKLSGDAVAADPVKPVDFFQAKSPKETPSKHLSSSSQSYIDAIIAVSGGKTAEQFSLWTNRETYRIGETISFHFKSLKPCYAVILDYNTKKELVQIFPNHFMGSQLIQVNREYTIPDNKMGFDLEVGTPTGQETLIAMVSDKPFQLFDASYTADKPFITINEQDTSRKRQLYKTLSAITFPNISQKRLTYLITR